MIFFDSKIASSNRILFFLVGVLFFFFVSEKNVIAQSVERGYLIPPIDFLLNSEPRQPVICSAVELETTLTGDLNLSDQAAVNALTNVTKLIGSLEVTGTKSLNLSPLQHIVEITGDLKIESEGMRIIRSFDCLTNIEGSLRLDFNENLSSVSDFIALKHIGGTLAIGHNSKLTEIPAFPQLEIIDTRLDIVANAAKKIRAPGFPELETIGSHMTIALTNLEVLTGLDALMSVGGRLTIESNSSLISIPTFGALTTLVGDDPLIEYLCICGNPVLSSVTGLQLLSLDNVDSVEVSGNPLFNCPTNLPNFSTNISQGNLSNCPVVN